MKKNKRKLNLADSLRKRNDLELTQLHNTISAIQSFGSGGEMSQADMYLANNKKPDGAALIAGGAAKGAMAGAQFGPWGAAIGGVVGGAAGVMKKIGGDAEYEAQLSEARTADNNAYLSETEVNTGLNSIAGGTTVGKSLDQTYAEGGEMYSNGGGINVINEGGTHEENPLGGVPMGNGNLVEEGEVTFDYNGHKYVISDRLKIN